MRKVYKPILFIPTQILFINFPTSALLVCREHGLRFGTACPLPIVSTARGSLNCHSSQLLAFLINRIPFSSSTQTFILVAIKQIWFVSCQITPLMKTMCVESRATVMWGRNVSVCFFVPQLPAHQPCHSWDPWSLAKERWMWALPIHP